MQIEILQGDCLELLSTIKDKSVNLIVTDPPYCIGTTSNGTKGSWSDNNLIIKSPFKQKAGGFRIKEYGKRKAKKQFHQISRYDLVAIGGRMFRNGIPIFVGYRTRENTYKKRGKQSTILE